MGTFISVDDLLLFNLDLDEAQAAALIDDAEALVLLAAPCIGDDDFANHAAVRAIIRGALRRWLEAGAGAVQSQAAGPYSVTYDNRQPMSSYGNFRAQEIAALRSLCSGGTGPQRAFQIDTTPTDAHGYGYWSQPDTWVPLVWP